jgi:hypothetical protein
MQDECRMRNAEMQQKCRVMQGNAGCRVMLGSNAGSDPVKFLFLQELYSYSASAFHHLLNLCWQVELMSSSNGQSGCVDFSCVQVLYSCCDFLFVFSADSLGCCKLSLGFGDNDLFLVVVFVYFPFY